MKGYRYYGNERVLLPSRKDRPAVGVTYIYLIYRIDEEVGWGFLPKEPTKPPTRNTPPGAREPTRKHRQGI